MAVERTSTEHGRTTLIGLGNALMGDDGVGVKVVESLRSIVGPSVECVTGGTAGMALIRYFLESDVVIVVDGVEAEAAPGTVFRFSPDEAGITRLRSHNSHGMGISYLVATGRIKGTNPRVVIFGIQVGSVLPNDCCLSSPVAEACPRVARLIMKEIGGDSAAG